MRSGEVVGQALESNERLVEQALRRRRSVGGQGGQLLQSTPDGLCLTEEGGGATDLGPGARWVHATALIDRRPPTRRAAHLGQRAAASSSTTSISGCRLADGVGSAGSCTAGGWVRSRAAAARSASDVVPLRTRRRILTSSSSPRV